MSAVLKEQSEKVTAEEEKDAMKKIERFREVKNCINSELRTIQQKITQVENQIRNNLKTDSRPNGVLIQAEQRYVDCLKV